jgi:hypothetical protein
MSDTGTKDQDIVEIPDAEDLAAANPNVNPDTVNEIFALLKDLREAGLSAHRYQLTSSYRHDPGRHR